MIKFFLKIRSSFLSDYLWDLFLLYISTREGLKVHKEQLCLTVHGKGKRFSGLVVMSNLTNAFKMMQLNFS